MDRPVGLPHAPRPCLNHGHSRRPCRAKNGARDGIRTPTIRRLFFLTCQRGDPPDRPRRGPDPESEGADRYTSAKSFGGNPFMKSL